MLMMMTILVMVFSAVLLDGLVMNRSHSRAQFSHATQLGQAREALIAFSEVHHKNPGMLPCPDMDFSGDGRGDFPCHPQGDRAVGWLPWRDLGLAPQRTRTGAPFWYVVTRGVLSSNSKGTQKQRVRALHLEGVQGLDQGLRLEPGLGLDYPVAAVIAPGELLAQQRGGIHPPLLSPTLLGDAHLLPIAHADLPTIPEG